MKYEAVHVNDTSERGGEEDITPLILNLGTRWNLSKSISTYKKYIFLPHSSIAHTQPRPPHCQGFTHTQFNIPHSVRLLWTSDRPIPETSI